VSFYVSQPLNIADYTLFFAFPDFIIGYNVLHVYLRRTVLLVHDSQDIPKSHRHALSQESDVLLS
jgi:hypothetical protein